MSMPAPFAMSNADDMVFACELFGNDAVIGHLRGMSPWCASLCIWILPRAVPQSDIDRRFSSHLDSSFWLVQFLQYNANIKNCNSNLRPPIRANVDCLIRQQPSYFFLAAVYWQFSPPIFNRLAEIWQRNELSTLGLGVKAKLMIENSPIR